MCMRRIIVEVGDREDSKKNAGSFDKLRTGSSTAFDAKDAPNFAQDDGSSFYANGFKEFWG